MRNSIDLCNADLNKSTFKNIMFFSFAEGGAMGETNAFHVVTRNLDHYYTNLGDTDISKELLFSCFPLLKKIHCFFE